MTDETRSAAGLIKLCAGIILFFGLVVAIGCVVMGFLLLGSKSGNVAVWSQLTAGVTLIITGIILGLSDMTIYALLVGFAVLVKNSDKTGVTDALYDINDSLRRSEKEMFNSSN